MLVGLAVLVALGVGESVGVEVALGVGEKVGVTVAVGEGIGVAVHVEVGVAPCGVVVIVASLIGLGVAVGVAVGTITTGDNINIGRCPTTVSCTLSDVAPIYTIIRTPTIARPMAT
ncbi:MAG: hypothetical protein ACUVSF_09780 [Anaerolineae bacterium]